MRNTQNDPLTVELIRQLHEHAFSHDTVKVHLGWADHYFIKGARAGVIKTVNHDQKKVGFIGHLENSPSVLGLFKILSRFNIILHEQEERCFKLIVSTPEGDYHNAMQKLLDEYKDKVKTDDPLNQLKAIVGFIQSLDFLHPFIDGNTRTFETLLLNRELIRHGFSPTILYDPNAFTRSSKREALFYVLHGMDNYDQFKREGSLPDCGTLEKISSRSTMRNPLR